MPAGTWLPYVLGGLGGLGVLLIYYGLRRVAGADRTQAQRRAGLWLVNAGVLCVAGSLALSIWA